MQLTDKEELARSRVCLPLDAMYSLKEVRQRIEELSPVVGILKVGKELFTRFGPEVVKIAQSNGMDFFLDLKYHDIPNTVKSAARAAAELGVNMFNVHAAGGSEMMKAAIEGAREGANKSGLMPKVIAVTVLTSIDDEIMNNEIGIPGTVKEEVLKLAILAKDSGVDGVVCSAADLKFIKDKLPKDFMFITPGIKGPNTPAGYDQKRVFTPGNAIQDGSTILVVNRAITLQEDKVKAAYEILQDMAKFL